jgi:hypothetical protein
LQNDNLSGGGSCSGTKCERFRVSSDGSSRYFDADNQVNEKNSLICVKKRMVRVKRKLTDKNSCFLLVFQNQTISDNTLDDDPWGKNIFANMSLDEVKY